MNKRKVGSVWEKTAAAYLEKQGLSLVEYNFYGRHGEIDIIARDATGAVEYIVFIEVKYRYDRSFGISFEAVGKTKQRALIYTAREYISKRKLSENAFFRFDVVGIDREPATGRFKISWIKNAFGG